MGRLGPAATPSIGSFVMRVKLPTAGGVWLPAVLAASCLGGAAAADAAGSTSAPKPSVETAVAAIDQQIEDLRAKLAEVHQQIEELAALRNAAFAEPAQATAAQLPTRPAAPPGGGGGRALR